MSAAIRACLCTFMLVSVAKAGPDFEELPHEAGHLTPSALKVTGFGALNSISGQLTGPAFGPGGVKSPE